MHFLDLRVAGMSTTGRVDCFTSTTFISKEFYDKRPGRLVALEVTEETTQYSPTKVYHVRTLTRHNSFLGPRKAVVTKAKISIEHGNYKFLAPVIVRDMEEEFLVGSDLLAMLRIDVIKFYFEKGASNSHIFTPTSLRQAARGAAISHAPTRELVLLLPTWWVSRSFEISELLLTNTRRDTPKRLYVLALNYVKCNNIYSSATVRQSLGKEPENMEMYRPDLMRKEISEAIRLIIRFDLVVPHHNEIVKPLCSYIMSNSLPLFTKDIRVAWALLKRWLCNLNDFRFTWEPSLSYALV